MICYYAIVLYKLKRLALFFVLVVNLYVVYVGFLCTVCPVTKRLKGLWLLVQYIYFLLCFMTPMEISAKKFDVEKSFWLWPVYLVLELIEPRQEMKMVI